VGGGLEAGRGPERGPDARTIDQND
jgi:hypothetical protein